MTTLNLTIKKNKYIICTAVLLFLMITGCNECETTADCSVGQICISGDCTNNDFLGDTDSDSDSDTDSDSDSDTDTDSDSDSDGDVCTSDAQCYDDAWCNGTERCLNGYCQTGQNPCEDDPGTLCQDESFCDEDSDACAWTITNEGGACSEPQFCLSDATMICKDGICKNPSNYVDPCQSTECQSQTCNEEQRKCIVSNINETKPCNEGLPCSVGNCQGGLCLDKGNPCFPNNAANTCMDSDCTPEASSPKGYTCSDTIAKNDTPCTLTGACSSSDAYCYSTGVSSGCWEGPTRPCRESPHNIFTAEFCEESGDNTFSCSPMTPASEPMDVSLNVNSNLFSLTYFKTIEYYNYAGVCTGLDYRGREAVLQLPNECVGRTTTITVSGTIIPIDILVLHMTNYRDPATCQAQGVNTLTINAPAATDQIILESESGYPQNFDLTVSCP